MQTEEIYTMASGEIGWIVLNRPERRNAITFEMWRGLIRLLDEADENDSLKIVIIRGSGTAAFAAGADLGDVAKVAESAANAGPYVDLYGEAQRKLAAFRKPTIAMIHGHCIGAGCGIATACDFRWADEKARFGVPAAKMGQVYRLEETRRLVGLIGMPRAKALLYTGRIIGGADALRFGLVDELVPEADLEARTVAFAEEIAAASQFSAQSMKTVFRAIDDGKSRDDASTTELFLAALHGEDYLEGMAALREKRAPKFSFR